MVTCGALPCADEVIPQLGVFQRVVKMLRDELYGKTQIRWPWSEAAQSLVLFPAGLGVRLPSASSTSWTIITAAEGAILLE